MNVGLNPTSNVPMATLKVNCPSSSLCNRRTTLTQRAHLEEQKPMGGIIPLAALLGSHCNLEHHICRLSFHFPNTPDCSWKSAQSLAQKQTITKQAVTNYAIERLYCYCRSRSTFESNPNGCPNSYGYPITPPEICEDWECNSAPLYTHTGHPQTVHSTPCFGTLSSFPGPCELDPQSSIYSTDLVSLWQCWCCSQCEMRRI